MFRKKNNNNNKFQTHVQKERNYSFTVSVIASKRTGTSFILSDMPKKNANKRKARQTKTKVKPEVTKKKSPPTIFKVVSSMESLETPVKNAQKQENFKKLLTKYKETKSKKSGKVKTDKKKYLDNLLKYRCFNPAARNRWKQILKVEASTRNVSLTKLPQFCEILLFTACFNITKDLVRGLGKTKVHIQKCDVDTLFDKVYHRKCTVATVVPESVPHKKIKVEEEQKEPQNSA